MHINAFHSNFFVIILVHKTITKDTWNKEDQYVPLLFNYQTWFNLSSKGYHNFMFIQYLMKKYKLYNIFFKAISETNNEGEIQKELPNVGCTK